MTALPVMAGVVAVPVAVVASLAAVNAAAAVAPVRFLVVVSAAAALPSPPVVAVAVAVVVVEPAFSAVVAGLHAAGPVAPCLGWWQPAALALHSEPGAARLRVAKGIAIAVMVRPHSFF